MIGEHEAAPATTSQATPLRAALTADDATRAALEAYGALLTPEELTPPVAPRGGPPPPPPPGPVPRQVPGPPIGV